MPSSTPVTDSPSGERAGGARTWNEADGWRDNARDPALRASDFETRQRHLRRAPLKLGALTFVSSEKRSPAEALSQSVELLQAAEQLGYDLGLVRVRHFQPYLSGFVSFLSTVAARTSTLRLGTAVIPFHAEDPIRLAEELSTLDLLAGGRLEIGLAATRNAPGIHTRWRNTPDDKPAVWERIAEFLSYLEGVELPATDETLHGPFAQPGPATVTPRAPGLRDRIWAGPGSLASVELTARHRLKLQISSLSTEDDGQRFEPQQYDQIARFRELTETLHPGSSTEVSVSRNIFPTSGGPDDDALRGIGEFFTNRLFDDGRHRLNDSPTFTARFSHPAVGSLDDVIRYLQSDVALAAADNLVVLVPSDLELSAQIRHLALIAEEIAPALREIAPALREAAPAFSDAAPAPTHRSASTSEVAL